MRKCWEPGRIRSIACLEQPRETPEPTSSPRRAGTAAVNEGERAGGSAGRCPPPAAAPPDLWRGVFFSKASCRGLPAAAHPAPHLEPSPKTQRQGQGDPSHGGRGGNGRCSGTQISALGIQREHEKMLFHWGGAQALPGVESPPLEILWTWCWAAPNSPSRPGVQRPQDPSAPTRTASSALSGLGGNQ